MKLSKFNEDVYICLKEIFLELSSKKAHDPDYKEEVYSRVHIEIAWLEDHLLSTKQAEFFKEEHLQRYDSGLKIPPDIKELKTILLTEISSLEKENEEFDRENSILFWLVLSLIDHLQDWLRMIDMYYSPIDGKTDVSDAIKPEGTEQLLQYELPSGHDTDNIRRYFDEAVKKGWAIMNKDRKLEWIGIQKGVKTKVSGASLAYFIHEIYCPRSIPWNVYNEYFTKKNLNADYVGLGTRGRQTWQDVIDELIKSLTKNI